MASSSQPTPTGSPAAPAPFALDFSQLLAAQCPLPGQPGAPLFDGRNVTRFARAWERFCEKYQFSAEKMVQDLVDYCDSGVSGYVESMIDIAKKELTGNANLMAVAPQVTSWPNVRATLLRKFRKDDPEQQKNTVEHLQALAGDREFRLLEWMQCDIGSRDRKGGTHQRRNIIPTGKWNYRR